MSALHICRLRRNAPRRRSTLRHCVTLGPSNPGVRCGAYRTSAITKPARRMMAGLYNVTAHPCPSVLVHRVGATALASVVD